MIDKSNMVGVLDDFPNQIMEGFMLTENMKVEGEFNKIVVAGMGGSGLPGDLMKIGLSDQLTIPVISHKSYDLPNFIDSHTLLFVISYSGNTEEAISSYKMARAKSCKLVVVVSGGKLKDMAGKDQKPLIVVPAGLQPRMGVGFMFFAMLRLLQNSGIIRDMTNDVKKLSEHLRNHEFKMYGEDLSGKLVDKVPIVYASESMFAVAEIWKIAFNENCKTTAWYNFFPELNHNEMVGFTVPRGNYYVIMVKEEDCHSSIAKRFRITKELLSSKGIPTSEILVKGSSKLMKVFTAIYMGYWTAYFLALKYGQDPTPVDIVEEFKKKL